MVSEECYDVATNLFNNWYHIDHARRLADAGEKFQAILITVEARAAVYDAGAAGALSEGEVTALKTDLTFVIDSIHDDNIRLARESLATLSRATFMYALQKTVDCECGEAKR